MEYKAHKKSILALSFEIYALLKKIFALNQFRYWPSME
jgi:hypothetical protein